MGAAAGVAGAGIVGSLIGQQQAADQASQAQNNLNRALAQYQNINIPSLRDQEVSYETPTYVGDFLAQQENAVAQGPTAMEDIQLDPRLQQAQYDALQQLAETGEMGMTPAQAAALRESQRQAAAQAQAKSAQLMDEYARRGMGGSGNELAARLLAGQAAADRANQSNNQIMMEAQQNALNAISQSANLAGQMGQQSFGQQSDIAKAKDYINQFNTQNQQQVQQRNVASQNQAGLRNLETKQSQANDAMKIRNAQQDQNKALIQQQFQNQMNLAAGRAGQYQNQAANAQQNAGRVADMWSGIGQGAGQMLGSYFANKKDSDKK